MFKEFYWTMIKIVRWLSPCHFWFPLTQYALTFFCSTDHVNWNGIHGALNIHLACKDVVYGINIDVNELHGPHRPSLRTSWVSMCLPMKNPRINVSITTTTKLNLSKSLWHADMICFTMIAWPDFQIERQLRFQRRCWQEQCRLRKHHTQLTSEQKI